MTEKEQRKTRRSLRVDEGLIERLEETVRKLGIEVRYDQIHKAGYSGGLCRVKKSWVLIISRASMPLERAELLAEAILTRDTSTMYLPPDVREVLDWVADRRKKDAVTGNDG